ncbi:MAG: ASCH domain-containing protein [Lachnospiraceae bacterium]|nr:ASCH domain-containing protein [Lachnospiraceae bacterium]
MTEKELWNDFITKNKMEDCEYEAWAFGAEPDLLARLAASGEKTATASAYPLYEIENEPLPKAGEYSVILDSKGEAVCVVQTKRVSIVSFQEVPAEHAYKEGEGDKSLDYWRNVHEEFFTACLEEAGLQFTADMKVVCEEFEVVYK